MAITQGTSEHHWNYLLAMESDLERLSRYIEFTPANYACFSIEIARILMAAGAEVDVVCKQLCTDPTTKACAAKNILEYRDTIRTLFPKIPRFEVQIARYGLNLHPWEEWNDPKGVPLWWDGYNATKHERHTAYHHANLKNALNAVAGLFAVILYLYKDKAQTGDLRPAVKLLQAGPEFYGTSRWGSHDFTHVYRLT